MKLKRAASFIVLLLCTAGAWGSALQVVDLNTTEEQGSSVFLNDSAQRFGRLYFSANDPLHGVELWASNGTEARTYLVRDLCPGPCNSFPRGFTAFNNKIYFIADDGVFGAELWASDGSADGTYMVRDLCPGPCSALAAAPSPWVRFKDQLYFVANDGQRRFEIWRTDGTSEGTQPAFEVCPGFCQNAPRILTATDDLLFVIGSDPNGIGLWASDGTLTGNVRLTSCGLRSGCSSPRVVGDKLFFLNSDSVHGLEPWHTDGTPTGTGLFADACPGTCDGAMSSSLSVLRDRVYFSGRLEDRRTEALLRLGASPGQIETVAAFPTASNVGRPVSSGDLLYFTASAPSVTTELFFTDGDSAPVRVRHLDQINSNDRVSNPVPATDQIFFIVNIGELWVAGRGQTGARHLLTLPTSSNPTYSIGGLTSLSQRVLMAGFTPETQWELWASDGTETGTRMVADIYRDPGSSRPSPIARLGERIVFGAQSDDDDATGLWISDGGEASTTALGVGPSLTPELFPVAGGLLYSSLGGYGAEAGLWLTDGTATGTRQLMPEAGGATHFTRIGERIFFSADDGNGEEPWVTDLTEAGTLTLGDLAPGEIGVHPLQAASSFPSDFVAAGQNVLFAAYGDDIGRELWQTDGTPVGTVLFADICPGLCSAAPAFLTSFAGAIYFAATDADAGRELWRSDGTVDGTARLIDVRPGVEGSNPHHLSLLNGELLFFADHDGQGEGLWAADSSTAGLRLVRELDLGDQPSFVTAAQLAAGRLFFVVANVTTGPELWVSDGTMDGTGLVKEIAPGPQGAYPQTLTAIGDRLLFAATDGETGLELWASNGTTDGTVQLADVATGSAASSPSELTAVGGQLVFAADDGISGRELWSIALSEPPCEDCLLGGRFKISVEWRDPNQAGNQGIGYAIPYSDETLLFWFFNPSNLELVVKMLDGRMENGYFWFFHGALTDVEYWITVEDQLTGAMRTYHSPPGQVCGQADTRAFPGAGASSSAQRREPLPLDLLLGDASATSDELAATGSCVAGPDSLCLRDGRFAVEVAWRNQHDGGSEGMGRALPATDESGFFWFFTEQNLELAVKILDGRGINGKFWVLYGALSDLEYWLTVTDTLTGTARTYHNPPGQICGNADIDAF